MARQQQATSWELRAAMRLSRLWQQQGKRAEAHELLALLYGWFSEGFDTANLQEAKALLEALGGEREPVPSSVAPVGPPASQRGATARGGQPRYEVSLSSDRCVWVVRDGMDCRTKHP
jgi:hypothetical protein